MPVSKSRKKKRSAGPKGTGKPSPRSLPDRRVIEGMMASLVGTPAADEALDRAQALIYDAWEEAAPKRRVALAAKALEISPLCADAHVLLAEHAEPGSPEQLECYRRGVAAGEAALGAASFIEDEGHFWGLLETRPYMRARLGLAQLLWAGGARDDALAHFRDMLRLNPNDNQGVRYVLAAFLMETDRDAELAGLLKDYDEDASAAWDYTKALAAFRRAGDDETSRRLLKEAIAGNPHVPAYLLQLRKMPKVLPAFMSPGEANEAICFMDEFGAGWARTPGAIDWLREHGGAGAAPRRRGGRGSSGRG
jgi:tetratricopeptide (TPR) repeat protein